MFLLDVFRYQISDLKCEGCVITAMETNVDKSGHPLTGVRGLVLTWQQCGQENWCGHVREFNVDMSRISMWTCQGNKCGHVKETYVDMWRYPLADISWHQCSPSPISRWPHTSVPGTVVCSPIRATTDLWGSRGRRRSHHWWLTLTSSSSLQSTWHIQLPWQPSAGRSARTAGASSGTPGQPGFVCLGAKSRSGRERGEEAARAHSTGGRSQEPWQR